MIPLILMRLAFSTFPFYLSVQAHASGRLPLQTDTTTFTSYAACHAALRAAYREDRKQVLDVKLGPNGERLEVNLTTKGVERLGPAKAQYNGTIWRHTGRLRADLPEPQIETSHSFKRRIFQCDGKRMTMSKEQGYTSTTFAPAGISHIAP